MTAPSDDGIWQRPPWRFPWRLMLRFALIALVIAAVAIGGRAWWAGNLESQRLKAAMEQGMAVRSAVLPYWVDYGAFPPSLAHAGYRPRRGEPAPVRVEQGYRVDALPLKVRLYFVILPSAEGSEWQCVTPDTKALADARPGCRYDPTFVRRAVASTPP